MKRILVFFLALFIFTGTASAATVYTKNVAGTVYYESGASSCDDVTAADTSGDLEAALTAAGASGILNICAGTYSGTMIDAADGLNTTASNQTVNGIGTVIIDSTDAADHGFSLVNAGAIINSIQFKNTPTGSYTLYITQPGTFNDVSFDLGRSVGLVPASSFANAAVTFNRCTFKNYYKAGSGYVFGFNNAATNVIFNYCIFTNVSRGLQLSKGTVTVNNCIFYGIDSSVIAIYANIETKVFSINNSIFASVGYADTAYAIVNQSTGNGTLTINNNLIIANQYNPQTYNGISGTYSGTGNIGLVEEEAYPLWTSYKYPAFIYLMIDDYANITEFETLASKAAVYGWGTTFALNTANVSAGDWARLQILVDNGHTIACHTRHHANMASFSSFQVQYVGADGASTMSISVVGNSLTTSSGLSLTLSDYDTVGLLCAAINTDADYTCVTGGAMTPTVDYSGNSIPEALADVTAQDIKTAVYLALYDQTLFFAEEIDGCFSDLETNLTALGGGAYVPKTFVFPGHLSDETSRDAVKTAGFLGAAAGNDNKLLSSVDIYDMLRRGPAALMTNIQHDWAAYATYYGFIGGVLGIFDHTIAAWGEANWNTFLLSLSSSGVQVVTYDYVVDWIVANGTPDVDGEIYTVDLASVWGDQTDYSLQKTSILRDKGISVGLTTDYFGTSIPQRVLPDIGIYEYPFIMGGDMMFWLNHIMRKK